MISSMSLEPEELVFFGVCDLAGQVRGKSVPVMDWMSRVRSGVGYTPGNICFLPFGQIAPSPFGTEGDVVLKPDETTEVNVQLVDGAPEHFVLCDVEKMNGGRWEFCPRDFLRRALERLKKAAGCELVASFEQEFVYTGLAAEPRRGYALTSYREMGEFGPTLMAALRAAGLTPDSFLPEFGPSQCEVTVKPERGMRAADAAVILRELTRAVARKMGYRATFAPMVSPNGVGSGTHIHVSFRDAAGKPAMADKDRAHGLSAIGEWFAAGVLEHMPALAAVTTPSVASYLRLTPGRWAPTWANVGLQDRAASLRVCPGTNAEQFNLEYRVVDATANPYMALGTIVHAGVDGIERQLGLKTSPIRTKAFVDMTDDERRAQGLKQLPSSLNEAVELLRGTEAAKQWFGEEFLELYLNYKMEEVKVVAGLDAQAICDTYAAVY